MGRARNQLSYVVQVGNRLFIRSKNMLKRRNKEHYNERDFFQPTKMGSWISSDKSEPEVKDSQTILQSADSPIIQLNWATFSTRLSSIAIIILLLILLGICYKKNCRSNRRAQRLELHDIIHSLHRQSLPDRGSPNTDHQLPDLACP